MGKNKKQKKIEKKIDYKPSALFSEKGERNWLVTIAKIIFFVCAFVLVMITVLFNMGGSGDSLKEGLEQFAGRVFGGRPAKIEKLGRMTFFPNIGFDASGINILSYPEATDPLIHIDHAKMAMGFWDITFGAAHVKMLYLEGLKAQEGALGASALSADKIYIDHDRDAGTASLRGSGKIDVHDWGFDADLEIAGYGGAYSYGVKDSTKFHVHIADIDIDGLFHRAKSDFSKIEMLRMASPDQSIMGDLVIQGAGERLLKLKGNFTIAATQKRFAFDLAIDPALSPVKISGKIMGDNLALSDIYGKTSVFALLDRINTVLRKKLSLNDDAFGFLQAFDISLDVDLKTLDYGGTQDNAVQFSFVQKDGMAKVSGVSGRLDGQDFSAPMLYIIEQKEKQESAMRKGEIIALMQEGSFSPVLLKIWNADLPDILFRDPQNNVPLGCAVGKAVVTGRIMKTQSVYFDLGDGALSGEGEYNIQDKILDVSLYPDGTIFKDTAVRLRGGIAVPKVEKISTQAVSKPAPLVLEKDVYDFLFAALKSNRADDPCLAFIEKAPVPEPEPEAKPVAVP